MTTVLQQVNSQMGDLVEKVEHTVVQAPQEWRSAGAGTLWHPEAAK